MATVRIIDQYEALSTDPKRQGQMDEVLVYMVDARGPFYHFSSKAGFDYNRAVQAIQATERSRAQNVGKTFTV